VVRRQISAVLVDLERELSSLERMDQKNQRELASRKPQLILLTEGVFFRAFRAYENYLEDAFLLYLLEKPTLSGAVSSSYLKPRNFLHARELLLSGKRFLDWTTPEVVMDRAETFLQNGGTVRNSIASVRQDLKDMKVVRNHIAHNSMESERAFISMLRRVRGTSPIGRISPGEHLLDGVTGVTPSTYHLSNYITVIRDVCEAIAER